MSTQNTTLNYSLLLAIEEEIQKTTEIVKEEQLLNETYQQVIQDEIEQLEQLVKEIQENERKAEEEPKVKSINKLNNKIDELTTERDRIIDLTEELEKDERQTQLKVSKKLSSKESKVKAIKEPSKKQMYDRPDIMFEGVSHIIARYEGREKHGYLDPKKFGKVNHHKYFWNMDDQEHHSPNSLHAALRMEVDGKLVQRDVWRDCEFGVYYVGDKEPTTIIALNLLHRIPRGPR
jgi:hypothetical protein